MPKLFFPFFLLILGIFAILRSRASRSFKAKQEAFWEREQRANLTRRKDISGLDYIQIPLDAFPIGQYADPALAELETSLTNLSGRQILNLSGISNTDLKLMYGAANLPALSDCDASFIVLARTIAAYGKRLAELGHPQEAIRVLEFGVSCKTDISTNYTLLGSLYRENGQADKVYQLAETVRSMDLLLKDSILRQLAETA